MLEFITLTFETPLPNTVAALKLSPTAILWKRCSKPVSLSSEIFALSFDAVSATELSVATFSLFTVSVTSVLSLDVAFDEFETEVDLLLFISRICCVLSFLFLYLKNRDLLMKIQSTVNFFSSHFFFNSLSFNCRHFNIYFFCHIFFDFFFTVCSK